MVEMMKRELAELAEKLARRDKIDAMLNSLRREERELAAREHALKAASSKEDGDVARLEKPSIASIFYTILGKKGEKLEWEQQEACAARLKYDTAVRQLDDCRGRMEALTSEKAALSGCDQRYEEVFRRVREALKADPIHAEQVCALEKSIGENASQLKEIEEALSAGRCAMRQVECVEESLNSAEGWGTWDILGGGQISDLVKHSHLDEAQASVEQLQVLLSRFRTELADVRVSAGMQQVNIDGFLRFADYFFDGIIADWSVLSRIRDSQESISQVKGQISMALSRLEALKGEQASEKSRLKGDLQRLVRDA